MTEVSLLQRLKRTGLVSRILLGMCAGILLALFWPQAALGVGLLGQLFVDALKAVAPILVFVLIAASIANHKQGQSTHLRPILLLYLLGTFCSAVVAVLASLLFPSSLVLVSEAISAAPPEGIGEVLHSLLFSAVSNPVQALLEANYIGILVWAVGLGIALRQAGSSTRGLIDDLSGAITQIVKGVISLAPLGIFGLVAATLAESGVSAMLGYAHL